MCRGVWFWLKQKLRSDSNPAPLMLSLLISQEASSEK
jgi:hypothetical protein